MTNHQDKRLMSASVSTDVLWYAYRTDTEQAMMVGEDYVGSAGWHANGQAGAEAAMVRALGYYPWLTRSTLEVRTSRPVTLPATDPSSTVPGWINPLTVHPNVREHVTQDNMRAAAEYHAKRNAKKEH